ncbi:MAG: glycosyltransferase family 2 protein [Lachnospiraceae bacterium]|nr:glycosyltransferase family 2 protein [Lachnospiraceae bacterium]
MMNDELVSIVVPVYNAGRIIEDTIQSVKAQTYENWELIMVDDSSSDDSIQIIGKHVSEKIILLRNTEGKGAAPARNTGVKAASGRYLCYLDADDLWDPEKIEKQLAHMKENDCAFSFTGYEFADENGVGMSKIVHVPKKIDHRHALKNTTIFTSTVMFDLSKLSKEDVMMPPVESEDTAAWWKILKKEKYAYGLDESLTLYRRSKGTLSSDKQVAIKRIWKLYREVEGLSVIKSAYCFVFWAFHAVLRRI